MATTYLRTADCIIEANPPQRGIFLRLFDDMGRNEVYVTFDHDENKGLSEREIRFFNGLEELVSRYLNEEEKE